MARRRNKKVIKQKQRMEKQRQQLSQNQKARLQQQKQKRTEKHKGKNDVDVRCSYKENKPIAPSFMNWVIAVLYVLSGFTCFCLCLTPLYYKLGRLDVAFILLMILLLCIFSIFMFSRFFRWYDRWIIEAKDNKIILTKHDTRYDTVYEINGIRYLGYKGKRNWVVKGDILRLENEFDSEKKVKRVVFPFESYEANKYLTDMYNKTINQKYKETESNLVE